jgi:hypothetical protein
MKREQQIVGGFILPEWTEKIGAGQRSEPNQN